MRLIETAAWTRYIIEHAISGPHRGCLWIVVNWWAKDRRLYSKPARIERKKEKREIQSASRKAENTIMHWVFDDNNISFFSKLNLFFRSIFALDKNATPNFVWLAVSLFWVSCTRSSQDVLTFQTFLWLLKWRSRIYFFAGPFVQCALSAFAANQISWMRHVRFSFVAYRSIFRTFRRKNVSLSLSSCERN